MSLRSRMTTFWWVSFSVETENNKRETIWAMSWKNLFMPYANNKGEDQPVHPRSLIRGFFVHCLDSKPLASLCSWAGQFESYMVANPEDRFSCDEAHMIFKISMTMSLTQKIQRCRTFQQYLSKCDLDLCHGQGHRCYTQILSLQTLTFKSYTGRAWDEYPGTWGLGWVD